MLSQVSTSFVAWTLYILEINVRIAVSLGVVGAGGLGQYIQTNLNLFNSYRAGAGLVTLLKFSEAAAGILMIIVIVLSVELLSSRLRARLRPGEHEGRSVVDVIMGLGDGGKWFGRDVEKR